MRVVVGGTYAGKRSVVNKLVQQSTWISSYAGDTWQDWQNKWIHKTDLILEGWENWILSLLQKGLTIEEVRTNFQHLIQQIEIEESHREEKVILIMLEMGRGIVPLSVEDRYVRDCMGWILQDAAEMADQVIYVWHGLSKPLKGASL